MSDKEIINIDMGKAEDMTDYGSLVPLLITMTNFNVKTLTVCSKKVSDILGKKYTLELTEDGEDTSFTLTEVTVTH